MNKQGDEQLTGTGSTAQHSAFNFTIRLGALAGKQQKQSSRNRWSAFKAPSCRLPADPGPLAPTRRPSGKWPGSPCSSSATLASHNPCGRPMMRTSKSGKMSSKPTGCWAWPPLIRSATAPTRLILEGESCRAPRAQDHGGSITFDAIGKMRTLVPAARLYAWRDKADPFSDGRVHAKVAVADARMCFITSANLTGHAMEKNMEAGVLISGGHIPRLLDDHLQSLVDMKLVSAETDR